VAPNASIDLLGDLGLRHPTNHNDHQHSEVPERHDRRHGHGEPYTDALILARIRQWARITGAPPTKSDWNPARLRQFARRATVHAEKHLRKVALFELGDWPSESTVRERFGSLNAALVAAGFQPRAAGRPAASVTSVGRPRTGADALRGYFRTVMDARGSGDPSVLKTALYVLAMSAIREADRISDAGVS
jgi:hypothetical protein